jgi:hypothetical protein
LKNIEPAVAANGLPVIAIQFLPCRGGFCVGCANSNEGANRKQTALIIRTTIPDITLPLKNYIAIVKVL